MCDPPDCLFALPSRSCESALAFISKNELTGCWHVQKGEYVPAIDFNEFSAEAALLGKTKSNSEVVVKHLNKNAVSEVMSWKIGEYL